MPSRESKYSLKRLNTVVIAVVLIFCFEYTVVSLGVIVPWLSFSVPGVLNWVVLTITTGMGLYCYLLTVLTNPGFVPRNYQHDIEDVSIEVKKSGGSARVCQKCDLPKPARAHHCKVCGCCVTRMDHHCIWVNNCVGHGNMKIFLHFLAYSWVALLQCMVLLIMHTHHVMSFKALHRHVRTGPEATPLMIRSLGKFEDEAHNFVVWLFVQTSCLALTFPLTLGLGALLVWQLYILSQNKTTIEYLEGVNASAHFRIFGQRSAHPYDLGPLRNMQSIFGTSLRSWLTPGKTEGSGVKFANNMSTSL